jgi:hypothetical protein
MWAGDEVCENFEFDETRNGWIKFVSKIKLFFLTLEMWGAVSDRKPFLRYEQNEL